MYSTYLCRFNFDPTHELMYVDIPITFIRKRKTRNWKTIHDLELILGCILLIARLAQVISDLNQNVESLAKLNFEHKYIKVLFSEMSLGFQNWEGKQYIMWWS